MAERKVLKEVMFEEEDFQKEPEPEILKEEIQFKKPSTKVEKSKIEKPKKFTKEEFLKSISMDHRPNSQRAIEAWENYNKG